MNRLIALLLVALPLPALAGECDRWTAAMQEDEGGPVMTAEICAPAGQARHELSVTCGTAAKLSIRYLPAGFVPKENEVKADLRFAFDREAFTRPAQYEEMDGAMVVDVDLGSPFTGALQTGTDIKVSDATGKVPGATFTLKGSRTALAKLIATCSQQ